MAVQGHIVVPTSHPDSDEVINHVTRSASSGLGGYSLYDGTGGWKGPDGIVEESHTRIVVDYDPEAEDSFITVEEFRRWLRTEAKYVREKLDEDAVLVELYEMEMELV